MTNGPCPFHEMTTPEPPLVITKSGPSGISAGRRFRLRTVTEDVCTDATAFVSASSTASAAAYASSIEPGAGLAPGVGLSLGFSAGFSLGLSVGLSAGFPADVGTGAGGAAGCPDRSSPAHARDETPVAPAAR